MDEVKEMFREIKVKLEAMENSNAEIVAMLKEENQQLKGKIQEQEGRLDAIERETRKNNIIITGIADINNETLKETEEKVEEVCRKIGVDINMEKDTTEVARLGIFKHNKNRPIIVKLQKWSKKREMIENAKKLKGTEIWISEDYSKKIQKERKELMTQLKIAREKGHRAFLKYNKLMVYEKDGSVTQPKVFTQKEEGWEGKRTFSERSPTNEHLIEQTRKASKTQTKNY